MKTFSMIREDLKNIRYYYSRQKEMTNSARIVGESTILKTIEVYNAAICQASPKLYELYVCMYVENKRRKPQPKNSATQENTLQDSISNYCVFCRTI